MPDNVARLDAMLDRCYAQMERRLAEADARQDTAMTLAMTHELRLHKALAIRDREKATRASEVESFEQTVMEVLEQADPALRQKVIEELDRRTGAAARWEAMDAEDDDEDIPEEDDDEGGDDGPGEEDAPGDGHPPPDAIEPDARLLTSREVGALLGLSEVSVSHLGVQGKLPRTRINGCTWGYPFPAVAALRDRRAREISPVPSLEGRPDVRWWGPRDRPVDRTDLISTADAAALLGNTRHAVAALVRRGVLPGYQERPYRPPSPILIPRYDVLCLAARPAYQKRRASCVLQRPQEERVGPGWPDLGLAPAPNRGPTPQSEARTGEQYSTRQAAAALGISLISVRRLARRGRLHAIRRKRRIIQSGSHIGEWTGGNRWLFFDKQEVHALLQDPDYQRAREAYRLRFDPARRAAREARELAGWFAARERTRVPQEPDTWWRDPSPLLPVLRFDERLP